VERRRSGTVAAVSFPHESNWPQHLPILASNGQSGGSDGLSVLFLQENRNVINPNAANTAARVNPAVEISARE